MPRPTTPSIGIRALAPKKLTRDELRERSAKGLCWHCDEPWSREHRYKKGWLLMIEPAEDKDSEPSEEGLEPEEHATEEELQLADYTVHALAGYSNPLNFSRLSLGLRACDYFKLHGEAQRERGGYSGIHDAVAGDHDAW
ncbi:hypothetical protein GW17_00061934 [Ensete ventricosum]|nr:hypothetical protein GW17_00061934 [Ensete ventricosum]